MFPMLLHRLDCVVNSIVNDILNYNTKYKV